MSYQDKHRENMRVRMAEKRAGERNIVIPAIVNMQRRIDCSNDLGLFLKTYFPESFPLPWGSVHLECLENMEYCILNGGQFAEALPRGSGKTTMAKGGTVWAVVNGHRFYGMLIGAKENKAEALLKDIKSMLRFNDEFADDYPEVALPVRGLNNSPNRTKTQTAQLSDEFASQLEELYDISGLECAIQNTEMEWTSKKIVMPTIEGVPHSGGIIEIAGITGDIRGRCFTKTDGTVIRPDLVLIDDPQTSESAGSPSQCLTREQIIKADIMNLGGPGQKVTCFMPCTIISEGDLAHRFLDHDKNPDWQGICSPMIISWPENMELWEEYNNDRLSGLKKHDKGKKSREFYLKNREELEKGASVSWEERKDKDDISALQHAMDLFFTRGKKAFYSEYQNDPIPEFVSVFELTEETVTSKVNGIPYREVPEICDHFVCMADLNNYGMHYTCLGATSDFAGYIADYGSYVDTKKEYIWSEEDTGGRTQAQAIYECVVNFCKEMCSRTFMCNGELRQLDLISIDCGWMMNEVFRAVAYANRILPVEIICSRGWANKDYRTTKHIGRIGDNCHRTIFSGKGRVLSHNADYWRQRCQQAFLCMPGSPGSLSIFGKEENHKTFAEHICSEILREHIQTEKAEYYNWVQKPGCRNDLLDSVVGAMVCASILGASFDGNGVASYVPNKKKDIIQQEKKDNSTQEEKGRKVRKATYSSI